MLFDSGVQKIIQLLADKDLRVRAEAARALGRVHETSAVNAVTQALQNEPNAEVRSVMCFTLGLLDDPTSVPVLRASMRSDSSELVRIQAAGAIYRLSRGKDAETFLREQLSSQDPHLRTFAAWNLAFRGDATALIILVAQLTNPDAKVRAGAATALYDVPTPTTVSSLIVALTDSEPNVRANAAAALGAVRDANAKQYLDQLLEDEDGNVRAAAAAALVDLGDTSGKSALHALLPVNPEMALVLIELGDESASQFVVNALKSRIPESRQAAVRFAGEMKLSKVESDLVPLLHDDSELIRETTVWTLGRIGGRDAVPALIEVLIRSDSALRALAAQALGRIGDTSCVNALHKWSADGSSDELVKVGVFGALIRLDKGGERVHFLNLLRRMLEDQDPLIRVWAASALLEVGEANAIHVLSAALSSPVAGIRMLAARALGDSGDQSAVPLLLSIITDPNTDVRLETAAGLGRLSSCCRK